MAARLQYHEGPLGARLSFWESLTFVLRLWKPTKLETSCTHPHMMEWECNETASFTPLGGGRATRYFCPTKKVLGV